MFLAKGKVLLVKASMRVGYQKGTDYSGCVLAVLCALHFGDKWMEPMRMKKGADGGDKNVGFEHSTASHRLPWESLVRLIWKKGALFLSA